MGGVRCRLGVIAVFATAGCGGGPDGYDPTLTYPPRTDPIVVRLPTVPPTGPAEPGRFDESLARFGLFGGSVIDPAGLPDPQKSAVRDALTRLFGTPAAPTVPADIAATDPHLSTAGLADGSRLYRRHCAHCHGLTGDGRGPSGPWLVPTPRDFRSGVFKGAGFGGKPTTAALSQLIRTGVPGTAMPALDLIPDTDVAAIVGYVVHLSLRGEAELRATTAALSDDGEPVDVTLTTNRAWKQWQAAADPAMSVGEIEDAAAVRRGHDLFASAGCASCHDDYGRAAQYRYDAWGGIARVPDLTRGEYRWGKDAADLARRVRYGIPGTAMPASLGLTDDQVRGVVAFLRMLPAPPRLPADVRDRIYPPTENASAMRR